MTTSRYDFHGVRIELESELEDVAAAMERRLRQFSTSSVARTDVTFAFAADSGNGTGLARPEGEGRAVYETPLGEVAYFPSGDVLYLESHDGVRAVCTGAEGRSRVSVSRAALANVWLLSRPLLTLPLVELLKRRGLFSVHAAGVELDGSGVVIAGASGSGKSTLALALVREGFHLLGDDMLFLREGSEGLRLLAFPDEVDVAPSTASFFPELSHLARTEPDNGWPKHRLRAEEVYDAPFVPECVPRVLIFPRVSAASISTLTPLDDTAALLELVPNVLLTEPRSSQRHLDALASLVAVCTCYRLETGRDFDRIGELVRGLLA